MRKEWRVTIGQTPSAVQQVVTLRIGFFVTRVGSNRLHHMHVNNAVSWNIGLADVVERELQALPFDIKWSGILFDKTGDSTYECTLIGQNTSRRNTSYMMQFHGTMSGNEIANWAHALSLFCLGSEDQFLAMLTDVHTLEGGFVMPLPCDCMT